MESVGFSTGIVPDCVVPEYVLDGQPFVAHPQGSAEWLAARRHRLTGSILPDIASRDMERWRRVGDVMSGKVDGDHYMPKDGFAAEAVQFGRDNEEMARQCFRNSGRLGPNERIATTGLLVHPYNERWGCSVDFLVVDELLDVVRAVGECKCRMFGTYAEPTPSHITQIRWNLMVLHAIDKRVETAYWVGYSRAGTAIRVMQRDSRAELDLQVVAEDFWAWYVVEYAAFIQ